MKMCIKPIKAYIEPVNTDANPMKNNTKLTKTYITPIKIYAKSV